MITKTLDRPLSEFCSRHDLIPVTGGHCNKGRALQTPNKATHLPIHSTTHVSLNSSSAQSTQGLGDRGIEIMADKTVLLDQVQDHIVKITLNRPKVLNAINVDLLESLVEALRASASAKVIVIEGAGARSFCAGEDLKQTLAPRTGSAEELRVAFGNLQDITRLTSSSSAIVISAVQGFAIGGGAEIALAADFVIGGPDAKFRFPEVPIGHAATGGITLRLTHMVGLLKAKELLLTGRYVDAKEALKLGLLSEIHEDPKSRALELALELAKLPAISLSSSKTSLERSLFPQLETCLHDEVNVASYCFAQSDAAKAFSDFASRKPSTNEKKEAINDHSLSPSTKSEGALALKSESTDTRPHFRDINSALSYAVQQYPDAPFIRFRKKDVTFLQFDSSIAKLAGGLQHLGIGRGDRLLVVMRNSVEMVETWLATNRLGAVWVPVNVELKSVTLKHVISAANPKLTIVDQELYDEVEPLNIIPRELIYVKSVDAQQSLFQIYEMGTPVTSPCSVKPSTTSAFLYTSGTTGKSKPCVLSHEYFILQASTLICACGLGRSDVLYCPFPLFHVDATSLTTIPAILLGCTAALSTRFTASHFWDEVREAHATVYDFMGATLALTFKQPPGPLDRDHHIRLAWGVPIPDWAPDYETRFNHKLITLYGSVEAGVPIFQSGPLASGSCGKVRPGHSLRIADEDDEPLPPNTPGHILLRSDNTNAFFHSYFNDPVNTASAFGSLWLHTGDLGKMDADGNVYFLGRVKDVIRRRGENVNAAEVEDEFLEHPDVVIAAAYGVPSPLGSGAEEDVKVAVKLRAGSPLTEHALWEWSRRHMARFQVPSVIEIVSEIARTPTGKIEKYGLSVHGGVRFDDRSLLSKEN